MKKGTDFSALFFVVFVFHWLSLCQFEKEQPQ